MAWFEYNDMWEQAQKNGKYLLFVLDIKNSRQQGNYYPHIRQFLYRVYFKIYDLEKERNHTILHRNKRFNRGDRGDLHEPFFFMGDLFGFTVLRGSISEREVYDILKETKEELRLPYQFYCGCGYYETDCYEEGNKQYFRGYAIAYIEHQIKKNKNFLI